MRFRVSYDIVDVVGAHDGSSGREGSSPMLKVFHRNIPLSPDSSSIENDTELKDVAMAYR